MTGPRRPSRWRPTIVLAAALALPGCGASRHNVLDAVIGTGLAVGAAGVSRALGGCYAACPPGTFCNEENGFCERVPCDGVCRTDEYCARTSRGEHCEPVLQPDLGPSIAPELPPLP